MFYFCPEKLINKRCRNKQILKKAASGKDGKIYSLKRWFYC
jgi:hypothetical protein